MSKTIIITIKTKHKFIAYFEAYFEGIATTISSFETEISSQIDPLPDDIWTSEAYFDKPINFEKIKNDILSYAGENNLEILSLDLSEIENIDFARKVLDDFIPIKVGKFYIYNSAHKDNLPHELIPMEISAGLAFGTGDHETTSGCIEFLSELETIPTKVLDMGTGSGVLSMAAVKLFNCAVVASDIDENSVLTANENFKINNVANKIKLFLADGYDSNIYDNGPYDLIMSNILARPLIEIAHQLAANLKAGGSAILAGFLTDQSNNVTSAHIKAGLKLVELKEKNNWVIALLSK